MERRLKVIAEIVSTEDQYVQNLKTVIEVGVLILKFNTSGIFDTYSGTTIASNRILW